MPGMGELLIILLIVLLIFGAGKLPQIGDALGRSIRNFKRSASGANEIEVNKKEELPAGKKRAQLEADDEADEAGDDAELVAKGRGEAKKRS